jgi:protein-tyrosine phosphatase
VRVAFPENVTVQATGIGRGDQDPEPDFGLYLDHRWSTISWDHELVDWPDFGIPTDEVVAFGQIRAAWARAVSGEVVEVGCLGGTGRTGTVLGCFAILAGIPRDEAVTWVRATYRPHAIETTDQEALVQRFTSEVVREVDAPR